MDDDGNINQQSDPVESKKDLKYQEKDSESVQKTNVENKKPQAKDGDFFTIHDQGKYKKTPKAPDGSK